MPSRLPTSSAMSSGPATWEMFCAICCSAMALPNMFRGTISPTHAWRAGPMKAKPTPMISVATVSSATVIMVGDDEQTGDRG